MNTVQQEFTILGISFLANVPATAADWDSVAGAGDCLASAIANHGYRGFASPVRTAIMKALEDKWGKRNDGETPDKYVARIVAEGKATTEDVQSVGSSAATSVTFESTLSGSSRAKVGKEWVDQATYLIGKWNAGQGSPESTLNKLRALVPGAQLADPTDAEALGAILRDFDKKKREQAASELL